MANSPLQLYHSVLSSLNLTADADGLISFVDVSGTHIPATLQDRRLVLPTPEMLKTIASTNYIAFHPLSENITQGQSPIIKRLITWITFKISNMLSVMAAAIISIANENGPLTAETTDMGKAVADVTPKTLDCFLKVIKPHDGDSSLVKLYLKRRGEIGANVYSRLAVVRFPIMDEFADGKPENEIFGEKITKKEKRNIANILRYILPNIDVEHSYSAGTNSINAPYFVSLMSAYYNVASRFVQLSDKLKSKIDEPDLRPNLDWYPMLNEINSFTGVIPPLPFNEGSEEIKTNAGAVATTSTIAPTSATPYQTATSAASPYKTATGNSIPQAPVAPATQPAHAVAAPSPYQTAPATAPNYNGVAQPGQPVVIPPQYPQYGGYGGYNTTPYPVVGQPTAVAQPDMATLVTMQQIANNPMAAMSAMGQLGMPGVMPGVMPTGMPVGFPGGFPGGMPAGMPGFIPGGFPGVVPTMLPGATAHAPVNTGSTGKYTTR